MSLETWRRRLVNRTVGWTQDTIQAAILGLTQEAKDYDIQQCNGSLADGQACRRTSIPYSLGTEL